MVCTSLGAFAVVRRKLKILFKVLLGSIQAELLLDLDLRYLQFKYIHKVLTLKHACASGGIDPRPHRT